MSSKPAKSKKGKTSSAKAPKKATTKKSTKKAPSKSTQKPKDIPTTPPEATTQAPALPTTEQKQPEPVRKASRIYDPQNIRLPEGVLVKENKNAINFFRKDAESSLCLFGRRVLLTSHDPEYGSAFSEITAEQAKARHLGSCRSIGRVPGYVEFQRVLDLFFAKN